MLILARNEGQQIVIADNIVVTVLKRTRSGGIRLGIEAPKEVPVHRREVYEAIRREDK
jgi:carbon storage regulator